MSVGAADLGRSVLYLSTDDSQLKQGIAAARQAVVSSTKEMRENARVILSADSAALRADLNRAQQLIAEGKTTAAKDLIYQIRTDAALLRAGLADAEREARAAKDRTQQALIYQIRASLPQFAADLRTAQQQATTTARTIAEAEQAFARQTAAEKRRLSQQSVQDARAAAQAGRQAAPSTGGGGGIGEALITGLGIGSGAQLVQTGLGLVSSALSAGKSSFIDYNAAIENTRAQLLAFTGSTAQADSILKDLRTEADKTPFTFKQMSDSIATLVPLSRQSGVALNDLIKLTETLAALNPDEANGGGFRGAALALGNAQSGDLQSLRDRFNISTQAIEKYRAQGLSNIAAIRAGLKDLGIDESLVGNLSKTFSGQLSNLQDALSSLAGRAGQPIFDLAKSGLGGANGLLNAAQVQQGATAISTAIAQMVADLNKELSRPETQQGLRSIASGLGAVTAASLQADRAFLTIGGGGLLKVVEGLGFLDKQVGRLNGGDGLVGLLGVVPHLVMPVLASFNELTESWARFVAILQTNPAIPAAIKNATDRIGVTRPGTGAAPPTPVMPTQPDYDPGEGVRAVYVTQQKAATERQRQAFLDGQAELQSYLRGFTSQSSTIISAVQPQLQAQFERLYGSLSADQQVEKGLGRIPVLAAKITDEVTRYGAVSVETGNQVRAILGAQADDVLRLADAYGTLAGLQGKVTAATLGAGAAAGNLATVKASADQATQSAQGKVTALEARARANATAAQNAAQEAQDRLDAVGRDADATARRYDAELRGLQATLKAIGRAADDAQRAFSEQLRVAQARQQADQDAATQHAAAYQAVLNGTTAEFLRQNAALDEQTRKIIETGNAAVAAQLKAKTAADANVQGLEVKQRRDLLDLEEKIRAARAKGTPAGEREARALEDQRNLVKARSDYALDLARQQAAVRGDELDAAKKPVEAAAQAQAAADKAKTDADQQHVADIQEQARQRAEADRAAQQALQDRIDGVTEEARLAAADAAERQRAIGEEIRQINERARQQATADQAAIDAANIALGIVKQIEAARIAAAQKGATIAQDAANAAGAEYLAQQNVLTLMGQKQTALDTYLRSWSTFIDGLKAQGIDPAKFFNGATTPSIAGQPSAVGGARDNTESGLNPDGTPKGTKPTTPAKPGIFDPPQQKSALFAPLPSVAYTPPAPLQYRAPQPPALNNPALAGMGAGATFARAPLGGGGPVTVHAPVTFPNAQFTSDIDVRQAVQAGHEAGLRGILAALDTDTAGGGALSGWRG